MTKPTKNPNYEIVAVVCKLLNADEDEVSVETNGLLTTTSPGTFGMVSASIFHWLLTVATTGNNPMTANQALSVVSLAWELASTKFLTEQE